ncbi:inositol monophosphatase family protein [Paenibacillus ehimensis]|uniref:inositol monophosphatase family protein n=1 Tax=Paenibacillus ehimensis TaxID=79264 RepID=UPI000470B35D|nr:inositol monophosphatase family protein [Paenibacillus ehimensis]
MVQVNVNELQELFAGLGEQLKQKYNHRTAPRNREEMFARFSEANVWATGQITPVLQRKYPDIQWSYADIDPEMQHTASASKQAYWVLDPVDGGVHLHQGFSSWSMALCLMEGGEPVFSLVYDPNRCELFHAARGQGAFLNGTRIRVGEKSALHDAFLVTAPPSLPDEEPLTAQLAADGISKLLPRVFGVRMLGSVALQLAYVASGKMDGYWEFGDDSYDRMAGALLVREAGGIVTDIRDESFTVGSSGIIAGNAAMHAAIRHTLG